MSIFSEYNNVETQRGKIIDLEGEKERTKDGFFMLGMRL
jgi:hypothetical protein